MSTAVSNFITRIICQNGGYMDYKHLYQTLRKSVTIAESTLSAVLRDKFVVVEGKEKGSANNALGADSSIIAKTSLRICKEKNDSCSNCGDLHLCRYLVCGSCSYGKKCKNSHDLDSADNRAVLCSHGLQELEDAELFTLLLQNDSSLLPEVCSHYNKGNGEHGSCKFKGGCKGLHVCQHFLQGDCAFGDKCKRAHAFDANAKEILKRRGVSPERSLLLCTIYRNMFAISGPQDGPAAPHTFCNSTGLCVPTADLCLGAGNPPAAAAAPPVARERSRQPSSASVSEADRNEICLFFLRRHCSFKENCTRVHYHRPYRWQVAEPGGAAWKDLVDMEAVEEAYCNPVNNSSKGISKVDFLTMTIGGSRVRRLSTVSSVTKPPHFILTTDWLWHWQGELGKWLEFGSEGDGDITSQTLENVYLADTDGEILFTAGSQHYVLYFKDMIQENVKFKTGRPVRRRPRFLSGAEVEKKLKSGTPEASSSTPTSVPEHWDQEALSDFEYKLTRLAAGSTEFSQVRKLFQHTMLSSTVHSIQRIQNPSLHKVFQWQKEKMQKKNGGRPVDQRLLFHGTEGALTQAICEQNFDWRICGVHGSLYGKGSYFARDASYSDRFSKSSKGMKTMFAVQVLVGEFTQGDRTYLRPPAKGPKQSFYDSCVDNVEKPAIFVVFEKHQIYPEYIIEYSP